MRGLGSIAILAGPPWAMGLPGGPGLRPLGAANIDYTAIITTGIDAAKAVSVTAIEHAPKASTTAAKKKKKKSKAAAKEAPENAPEAAAPASGEIPTWVLVLGGLLVVGGGGWLIYSRRKAA